ncbi:hypothetical protein ACH5RR_009438 [Cinchona calisaya]|uniref:Reverse transcriptase RNase H-like domain-containing protein n=1 Tax=Cinchona calisaya TaxID=153742 RepID=A0ABD3AE75_9GENT
MHKKDKFKWCEEFEKAFEKLKMTMSVTLVLALPNFTKPFIIETDACHRGIGAMLMQEKRPMAYFSKALSRRNLGFSIYEKELLALVSAISKWRHYLEGHHFIIKTDHQRLKYLLEQRITTLMQQKWLTKLLGLNFEIHCKQGSSNVVADALSRRGVEAANCNSAAVVSPSWVQEFISSYEEDQLARDTIEEKIISPYQVSKWNYHNGILKFKG